MKGRKRTIQPIPAEMMQRLFVMCENGAALDFEESSASGFHIYPLGEIGDMDDIPRLLDQHRERRDGIWLEYDTAIKKWHIDD